MNATQQGTQQARVTGNGSRVLRKVQFESIGRNNAALLYKTEKARYSFLSAWCEEWNDLPTAEMPAIKK